MDLKVTYVVWLLAIYINQTMSADDSRQGGGAGAGGGSGGGAGAGGAGGGAGGHGGGAAGGGSGGAGGSGGGGAGGGSGSSGAGGGAAGHGGAASPGFAISGMNGMMPGMNGVQLPFPFFPPFMCEMECLPMQYPMVYTQPVLPVQPTTPVPTRPAPPPTPPPTTTMPTTTARQVVPIPTQRPVTPNTYISQTYIMYPNWCQGWCRFFYKPTPPPVYYQPNCLLFSWMGLGMGMGM